MSSPFRSPRERRLWLATGLCLAAIYTLVFVGRPLAESLRESGQLRMSLGAVCAVVGGWILASAWRTANRGQWAVLGVAALLFAAGLWRLKVVEERLHLVEYGVLAAFLHAALLERQEAGGRWPLPPWFLALLLAAAFGWGDEGLQALHPRRFYDLRDVALNAGASALGVATLAGFRWAGRRQRDAL